MLQFLDSRWIFSVPIFVAVEKGTAPVVLVSLNEVVHIKPEQVIFLEPSIVISHQMLCPRTKILDWTRPVVQTPPLIVEYISQASWKQPGIRAAENFLGRVVLTD